MPDEWQSVALPHVAASAGPSQVVQSLWYRMRFAPGTPSNQATYLYIPRWQSLGKIAVYADGKLIYAPHSGPFWTSYNLPIWILLAEPDSARSREILININRPQNETSGLSTIWVGDYDVLAWRHDTRRALQIEAPWYGAQIILLMGFATALIWLRKRNEPTYLLIFGIALMVYVHSLEYFVGDAPVPLPDGIFQWMEIVSKTWYLAFTFIMIGYFFEARCRLANAVMLAASAIFTLVTFAYVVQGLPTNTVLPNLWFPPVAQTVAVSAVTWIAFVKAPTKEGFVMCFFMTLLLPAGLYDLAISKFVLSVENVYLLPILVVIQMILFFYIILNRHLRSLFEAEGARVNLMTRLDERENELQIIHQRLRESDRRQTLEQERQRLMRDMHDGIGSTLMGALVAVEHGKLNDSEVIQLLRACIDDLKLVIDSLEPGDNDLLLLLATVRYRLEPRFEQAGIALSWDVDVATALPPLAPEAALHVLRIIQEIFTNIVKHAKANQVTVSVRHEAETILVAIADNGVGIAATEQLRETTALKSRGLSNLTARAKAVGGTISWDSKPGSTVFKLRLGRSQQ